MSTLKVNKLRDTAGSADAITLDPNGGAVLAGVTTMTTARVTSGIVTKKQTLRDAPAASGISTAASEADLKAQWDTTNLGTSPYT